MKYRASRSFAALALIGFSVLSAHPVMAVETVLKTKCVTTVTKALHAADLARFEKDIAPFKDFPSVAKAIQTYREGIAIAWEAMEQPYCGTGSPGYASAKKSYIKTVTHVRAAFLANAKKPTTSIASLPLPKSDPIEAPVVKPTPVVTSSVVIPKGLAQGMRSAAVLELQKRLLKHFKQTIDDSNATGFFGPKTRDLVIRFQLEKKFIPSRTDSAAGLVGPKTVAALNAL